WPYILSSDGPLAAYTSDYGVYGLLLQQSVLGFRWVTGTEAFCKIPFDALDKNNSSNSHTSHPLLPEKEQPHEHQPQQQELHQVEQLRLQQQQVSGRM
ncbi:hypothetical protein EMWEY_00050770, partial [Eimeria maxima]